MSQDRNGHQFISVLDLEDKALHQDLPPTGAQDVRSIRSSSPTSAQLHVLATSVIRNAAAADPQPIATVPEDLLNPTTRTGLYISLHWVLSHLQWRKIWSKYLLYYTVDIPEDLQPLSYIEPLMDPERVTRQDSTDPSGSEIFRAIKTQSVGPRSPSSTPPAVWFHSRLSTRKTFSISDDSRKFL